MPIPLVGAVPKARYVLGAVRLFNGAATLFATRPFGKRLGVDPDSSPAAVYALRLFGVRTIYIGAELLFARGDHLQLLRTSGRSVPSWPPSWGSRRSRPGTGAPSATSTRASLKG